MRTVDNLHLKDECKSKSSAIQLLTLFFKVIVGIMERNFDREEISVAHVFDKGIANGFYLPKRIKSSPKETYIELEASFPSNEPSSNGLSHQMKRLSFDGSSQNSDVDPVSSKHGKSNGMSTNQNRSSSATPSISIDSSYDGKYKDLMVRFKVPVSPPGKHGEEMDEGYEIDESALTDAATMESESVVNYHCPVLPPQNDGESPPPPRREEIDDVQVASSREHAEPPQTRQRRRRRRPACPCSLAVAAIAIIVCAIIGGLFIVIVISMYGWNFATKIYVIVGILLAFVLFGTVLLGQSIVLMAQVLAERMAG